MHTPNARNSRAIYSPRGRFTPAVHPAGITVRSAIREEVRRVAADEADREEMRAIREQMAEFAPCAD
jgi:hypothetical protein